MIRVNLVRPVAFGVAIAALIALQAASRGDTVSAPTWPHTYTANGATAKVFQPQVKSWNNDTVLDGLAAVALTPPGAKPVYGTATFTAYTSADFNAGTVRIVDPKITGTHWPDQSAASSSKLDSLLRSTVRLHDSTIPLATVLASVKADEALPKSVDLNHDAPPIYYSETPAILVIFDGNPIMAPIQGTDLKYAVNTNWNVIYNGADSHYYLLDGDSWISATGAQGPWSPATAPASFSQIPASTNWKEVRDHLNAAAPTQVPTVFVSTTPADMILVDGSPEFSAISNTNLRYVVNTDSAVFSDSSDGQWYVLLSGRWFKSADLHGPWTYATDSLPSDFQKIPPDSPRANVLVSVPGTSEAQYAGAAAAAPQIVKVDPATTKLTVTYGPGDPQFSAIAGTSLQYAVNTPYDVIKVSDSVYYACHGGIWFRASSPNGPWAVASSVPSVIYTIPPSSALYADTYVNLYDNQGNVVVDNSIDTVPAYPAAGLYFGYTAGYLGGYWAADSWWYGTGYYYPGYYYPAAVPVYYPYASTYAGGSYYTSRGAYGNYASAYGPYGGATARAQYNPSTGTYARGGSVYGPYGAAAGGSFYNPRYGVSGATMQYSNPYGSWGHSAISTPYGNAYAGHATNSYGTVAASASRYGTSAVARTSNGDVYAGHDGNVYSNQNGSWQKYNGTTSSWQNVDNRSASSYHPSSSYSGYHPSSDTMDGLNRDYDARSQGASGFRGFSGGGGGFRR
jgi:hypothetical protein